MTMTNDSSGYHPTFEDMQLLRNLVPDKWEVIWEQITIELWGSDCKGRLYQACKRCLRERPDSKEEDYEPFTSFVYECFLEKVKAKQLFDDYDHQLAGGNVYSYLCNPKTIFYHRDDFLKKELGYDITFDKETGRKKYSRPCQFNVYEPPDGKQEEEIDSSPDDDFPFSFPEDFNLERIALKIPPETEKFDAVESQAGIQLYPRLDGTDNVMVRLMEQVRTEVYQANVTFHADPDKIVREEHVLAIERLERDIERYNKELYDSRKQTRRKENTGKYQDNLRKKNDTVLEIYLYPLNAEQLVRLLRLSRETAYQRRSRYKSEWKSLFFSPEYIQEMEWNNE